MPEPLPYETPPAAGSKKKPMFWLLLVVGIVVLLYLVGVLAFFVSARGTSTMTVITANPPAIVPSPSAQFEAQTQQILNNRNLTQPQMIVQLADLIRAGYKNGALPSDSGAPTFAETIFLSLGHTQQAWDVLGKDKCKAVLQSIIDGYPNSNINMPSPQPAAGN